jgi:hypothetical protein
VNPRDQVEAAGEELQANDPRHLGDLLVAIAVRAQSLDIGVADLGRRGEHVLREGGNGGGRRILDVPWRASWISLSGTPS